MKYVLASLLAVGLIGGTASATDGGDTLTGDRITGDNIKQHQADCTAGNAAHCPNSEQKKAIKERVSSAIQDRSEPDKSVD